MATAFIMVQVPPGPVPKPNSKVVANIQKMVAKVKQTVSKAETSKGLFFRVMEGSPSLCVARISAPMDTCEAI